MAVGLLLSGCGGSSGGVPSGVGGALLRPKLTANIVTVAVNADGSIVSGAKTPFQGVLSVLAQFNKSGGGFGSFRIILKNAGLDSRDVYYNFGDSTSKKVPLYERTTDPKGETRSAYVKVSGGFQKADGTGGVIPDSPAFKKLDNAFQYTYDDAPIPLRRGVFDVVVKVYKNAEPGAGNFWTVLLPDFADTRNAEDGAPIFVTRGVGEGGKGDPGLEYAAAAVLEVSIPKLPKQMEKIVARVEEIGGTGNSGDSGTTIAYETPIYRNADGTWAAPASVASNGMKIPVLVLNRLRQFKLKVLGYIDERLDRSPSDDLSEKGVFSNELWSQENSPFYIPVNDGRERPIPQAVDPLESTIDKISLEPLGLFYKADLKKPRFTVLTKSNATLGMPSRYLQLPTESEGAPDGFSSNKDTATNTVFIDVVPKTERSYLGRSGKVLESLACKSNPIEQRKHVRSTAQVVFKGGADDATGQIAVKEDAPANLENGYLDLEVATNSESGSKNIVINVTNLPPSISKPGETWVESVRASLAEVDERGNDIRYAGRYTAYASTNKTSKSAEITIRATDRFRPVRLYLDLMDGRAGQLPLIAETFVAEYTGLPSQQVNVDWTTVDQNSNLYWSEFSAVKLGAQVLDNGANPKEFVSPTVLPLSVTGKFEYSGKVKENNGVFGVSPTNWTVGVSENSPDIDVSVSQGQISITGDTSVDVDVTLTFRPQQIVAGNAPAQPAPFVRKFRIVPGIDGNQEVKGSNVPLKIKDNGSVRLEVYEVVKFQNTTKTFLRSTVDNATGDNLGVFTGNAQIVKTKNDFFVKLIAYSGAGQSGLVVGSKSGNAKPLASLETPALVNEVSALESLKINAVPMPANNANNLNPKVARNKGLALSAIMRANGQTEPLRWPLVTVTANPAVTFNVEPDGTITFTGHDTADHDVELTITYQGSFAGSNVTVRGWLRLLNDGGSGGGNIGKPKGNGGQK